MSGPPRLVVEDLRKSWRKVPALDGVSFEIAAGEVVGLVGPNGAGKSTTAKAITGQILPDSGTVRLDGLRIDASPLEARRRTGYVPQRLDLYPFLTGREVLEFVASVRELDAGRSKSRIDELLGRFALTDAQHRLAREYSDGMVRKLAVAAALLGDPALLVLDESLTGLDPRATAEVKSVVREVSAAGTAVLFVTHDLPVLERIATRVLVMDRGRVVRRLERADLDRLPGTLEDVFLEATSP